MLTILQGDVREKLKEVPDGSIQCCVTSPPYFGLRDYGVENQIGLEKSPEDYIHQLVTVFREIRRALKMDGTAWLNLGDSYAGGGRGGQNGDQVGTGTISGKAHESGLRWGKPFGKIEGLKSKDLIGIPWMAAFALRNDGWYLRQDIIWAKPSCMPESVTDRCTKSHEYIFLLTKSSAYYYDQEAIKVPQKTSSVERCNYSLGGFSKADRKDSNTAYVNNPNTLEKTRQNTLNGALANRRSVWSISNTVDTTDSHFATFPKEIPKLCILAGSKPGDIILDPFAGSGTTGMVAIELGRSATLIELNPEYVKLIERRFDVTPGFIFS